ncbi:MAG: hypothetical protein RL065_1030 [Bacteroidota bacterium]|jgi:hypothetical protein
MKKIILPLFLLFIIASAFKGDGLNYKKITAIDTKSSHFTTDNLQNFYLIEDNKIVQYNNLGLKQKEFNEVKFGRPGLIEASNPLQILVLYPNQAKALILDRQLTLLYTIDFRSLGYQQVKTACLSRDNKIWIFDASENKLKLFDFNGKLVRSSEDITQITGKGISPAYMLCNETHLYVSDPTQGILVFDSYGDYHKEFFIKGTRNFQLIDNLGLLLYVKKHQLKAFNLKSFEEIDFSLPDSIDVRQARIEQNRLYLLHKEKFMLYEF